MAEIKTVSDYIDSTPEPRRGLLIQIADSVRQGIPSGFEECLSYKMIGWVVPLSLYPKGYHTGKGLPLPFINLAAQSSYFALYHSGIYADKQLFNWFTGEYESLGYRHKINMGKSCIRFKYPDEIPFKLIEELSSKITAEQWINIYEKTMNNRR